MNHLWVAEVSENSTYFLSFDSHCSHLKDAAVSAESWGKTSELVRIVHLHTWLTPSHLVKFFVICCMLLVSFSG